MRHNPRLSIHLLRALMSAGVLVVSLVGGTPPGPVPKAGVLPSMESLLLLRPARGGQADRAARTAAGVSQLRVHLRGWRAMGRWGGAGFGVPAGRRATFATGGRRTFAGLAALVWL